MWHALLTTPQKQKVQTVPSRRKKRGGESPREREHFYSPQTTVPRRGGKRPVVKGGKILFYLSRLICSEWIPAFFLIFTTRVGLKTRLNGVKSIRFEQCRKFWSCFLFEKNRFPGDPQKHLGNSARYPPLVPSLGTRITLRARAFLLIIKK